MLKQPSLHTEQRAAMVQRQLRQRGIGDERVLAAMNQIPREAFVQQEYKSRAYEDSALPIGFGQTISQPYMVAKTLELAELRGEENVLEVGAGSGYQAALLGRLAANVVAVERVPELAQRAAQVIGELHITNVVVAEGDGSEGYSQAAPFDAIVVAAGAPEIPQALVDQLKMFGRLIVPVGDREIQTLQRIRKTEQGLEIEAMDRCVYVPLIGAQGWNG